MRIAAVARLVSQKIVRIMRMHQRQRRVISSYRYIAPTRSVAFLQRHQNANRAIKTGTHINDGAPAERRRFHHAIDRHHAGHSLHYRIIAGRGKWSIRAKPGNATMDQARELVFTAS